MLPSNPQPGVRSSPPALARLDMRTAWYPFIKRSLDVILSLVGLVLLSPVLAVVAILIKLDSKGPVLFRQERIGRGFRPFTLFKFRTMKADENGSDRLLTVGRDARITRAGQLLRSTKLDELPQLFNVLKGEMSLVGPRPEVRKYVDLFRDEYARILRVRPGITDLASFKYRNEADILADAEDPEREYIERVMPDKLRVADDYIERAGLSFDLTIMLKTVVEAVWGQIVPLKTLVVRYRRPLVVGIHILLVIASNYAAFWLRFDGRIEASDFALFAIFLPWLVLCRAVLFVPFRLHEGLWRYTSLWDLRNIIGGVGSSSLLFFALVRFGYGERGYPRSVYFIDAILAVALMGGIRLTNRIYSEMIAAKPGRRILVFGAGDLGEMTVRGLKKHDDFSVVGFVDDDGLKVGRRIHGVPVLGTRADLDRIMGQHRPHEVLVAISQPEPTQLRGIVRAFEPYKVPIKTVPNVWNLDAAGIPGMRNLTIEDLLSRPPVGLDPRQLQQFITGRRVLVTGAGGSIGAELARQLAAFRPTLLVLLDRYENGLYEVVNDVPTTSNTRVVPVIGDVTDRQRVREIFAEHGPEIVLHAAAHKHVPLMEQNPCEAVKNNVRGTRLVAEASAEYGVKRLVLISTDKAVNPSSVMGATKRVAELLVQQTAYRGATTSVVVRFGNVLGSNGSVVPLFLDQIEAGGPVTVTHPEMRRYFMLTTEAVQLVLYAASIGSDGGTFVLDMGEQVKIVDLARDLIRLAGFVPESEIPITFSGVRPGEKLFEEISMADEVLEPSGVDKILKARPRVDQVTPVLVDQIQLLEELAAAGDTGAVMRQLRVLVPSFNPTWEWNQPQAVGVPAFAES